MQTVNGFVLHGGGGTPTSQEEGCQYTPGVADGAGWSEELEASELGLKLSELGFEQSKSILGWKLGLELLKSGLKSEDVLKLESESEEK